MAKADFCFTYYDGDAARDMAHMNRLERGAYSDIIISQRKFGHLTKDQIKKILGKDFDECFGAIELVLKRDENQRFFVEWLEFSEKKAKLHSKRQSENRNGKTKNNQTITKQQPNSILVTPLGDGNGDDNGNEFELNYKSAFDEIYIDQLSIKFKGIDLTKELADFRFKCDSAPTEYHCRDRDGLRLGFLAQLKNTWLSNTKVTKTNGNKKQQHTDDLIRAHAARWGSDATQG